MNEEQELLQKIRNLINAKKYRIRIHALRHAIEEGFSEKNLIEALTGKSKILENYPDELRCLVLGHFLISETVWSPLHVVCDYSKGQLIDIVTAYIPQEPWWITPTKRGRLS